MKNFITTTICGALLVACGGKSGSNDELAEPGRTLAVTLPVLSEVMSFEGSTAHLFCGQDEESLSLEAMAAIDPDLGEAVFTTTSRMREGVRCDIRVTAAKASDAFILANSFDGDSNTFYRTNIGEVKLGIFGFELHVNMFPTFVARADDQLNEGQLIFKNTPAAGAFVAKVSSMWNIEFFAGNAKVDAAVTNLMDGSSGPNPFQPNPILRLLFDVNWDKNIVADKVVVTTPAGAVFEGQVGYAQSTGVPAIISSLLTLVKPAEIADDKLTVHVKACQLGDDGCPTN